jgi:GntR family transcriptional repressor for pyruvate dehydrogenase complex
VRAKFSEATKVEKISDNIISQVRDAILSGKLKPGDRLASEKELISDFGASKATVREALRVLEVMGLVEIKKGIGGGIFIAEVDMKTTVNSIINFLHFKPVSITDITMVRYIYEPAVAQIAAPLVQPKDIEILESMITEGEQNLRANVAKGIGFRRYLARMTENSILILIVDFIDNLLTDINIYANPGPEFYKRVEQDHLAILEYLRRKDGIGASRAMVKDILEVGAYLAERTGSPVFDPTRITGSLRGFQHPFTEEDVASLQYLESLIGDENVAKLQNQGVLLIPVGTGKLFLIDLTHKSKPNASKDSA